MKYIKYISLCVISVKARFPKLVFVSLWGLFRELQGVCELMKS